MTATSTTAPIASQPAPPRRLGRVATRCVSTLTRNIGIIALGLFILAPLVTLAVAAFAETWFYPSALPTKWSLVWWGRVLTTQGLGRSIELSVVFAVVATLVSAVLCLPAAYAFGRHRFRGKTAMMMSIFAVNAFPKIGLYIALASLLYAFNLIGSFAGVIVVQALTTIVTMTWIPAGSFASVPAPLEEAARDAGASRARVFWTVTLPLARPGILVAVILSFLSCLDESQGTLLVGVPNYVTMPVQMYTLLANFPGSATAVFSVILTLPSVVLLLVARRYLFDGTLASGYQLR
jgi:putative spermidine/putrescine transport system permease protein